MLELIWRQFTSQFSGAQIPSPFMLTVSSPDLDPLRFILFNQCTARSSVIYKKCNLLWMRLSSKWAAIYLSIQATLELIWWQFTSQFSGAQIPSPFMLTVSSPDLDPLRFIPFIQCTARSSVIFKKCNLLWMQLSLKWAAIYSSIQATLELIWWQFTSKISGVEIPSSYLPCRFLRSFHLCCFISYAAAQYNLFSRHILAA